MATLTTVKGINRTLVENIPRDALDLTQDKGKVRFISDSYTVGAGDNFGTSGLIRLFDIPKGARLIDFEFTSGDLGTTGTLDIGWAASRELNSAGTAVEAASAAGIIAGAVVSVAVSRQKMLGSVTGYMKKFMADVEVQADFSVATTAAAGLTLIFAATIVMD